MEQPMDEPSLYLVRVWRQPERFRASVRRADEERSRWFTAPAAVAAFLADGDAAAPAGAPTEPPLHGDRDGHTPA
jgi:hypothetical protein